MVTAVDERNGLVKTYWKDIRDRVAKVEPQFARIVDELDPGKEFPIYLVYFPYGALIGDTISQFLPRQDGGYYRLSDPDAPKDVLKDLSYGANSAPLGMVLEKEIEYFIDLPDEGITIPRLIYSPGKFFPLTRVLSKTKDRNYAPNGVLTISSGARSAFLLPNIGCMIHHTNLQRDFNVQKPPPKSLYEHWDIFKAIIASSAIDCSWRSSILYFSESWVDKLLHDKTWQDLKMYLFELAWSYFEYQRNKIYYDTAFSLIMQKRNLKPNPYLVDTARHLFATALCDVPGYAPACDDRALPMDVLQRVFVESYGLKQYIPTLIHPMYFTFEQDKDPVYYSLQAPSTYIFSPKSRKVSSTLCEMRELEHIMGVFAEELSQDNSMCTNSVIHEGAKSVKFRYFHNKPDRHHVVHPSTEIAELDRRFVFVDEKLSLDCARFASDGKFVRGCVSISSKQD